MNCYHQYYMVAESAVKKKAQGIGGQSLAHFTVLARPAGFEPATYGSVDRRSVQLSYGRAFSNSLVAQKMRIYDTPASSQGATPI